MLEARAIENIENIESETSYCRAKQRLHLTGRTPSQFQALLVELDLVHSAGKVFANPVVTEALALRFLLQEASSRLDKGTLCTANYTPQSWKLA